MDDALTSALRELVAILRAIPAMRESRAIEETRVFRGNGFRCVFRALRTVEASLNISFGSTGGRRVIALEAVVLSRASAMAALSGDLEWMGQINHRLEELRIRLGGVFPDVEVEDEETERGPGDRPRDVLGRER